MRLGHRRRVVTHTESRNAEGPRARPAQRVLTGDLERLAPPGEPVVRAELCEAPRSFSHSPPLTWLVAQDTGFPTAATIPTEPRSTTTTPAIRSARMTEARRSATSLSTGTASASRSRWRRRERGTPRKAARRARGQPGRRRHRRARSGRTPRRPPRRREPPRAVQHRPAEAVAPESYRHPHHHDARHQSGARLRQHQSDDRDVYEQRHPRPAGGGRFPRATGRAPHPRRRGAPARSSGPTGSRSRAMRSPSATDDGIATPSSAHTSAAASHHGEQDCERPAAGAQRAERCAEHDERQVDEPAVEPGPRRVTRDRPSDRHARQERQRPDAHDNREPITIEPRNGKKTSRRAEHDQRGCDHRDDPRDGHRPVAGTATVEDGQRQQRSDDAAECEGETARRIGGGLRSRRRGLHRGATLPRAKVHPSGVSQIVYPSLTVDSFAGGRLALRPERSSVSLATRTSRRFSRTAQTLLIASLVALVAVVASPVAPGTEQELRAGDHQRLVRRRPDRQALRAPLLQGGDPRAPGRHRHVLARLGGHLARPCICQEG